MEIIIHPCHKHNAIIYSAICSPDQPEKNAKYDICSAVCSQSWCWVANYQFRSCVSDALSTDQVNTLHCLGLQSNLETTNLFIYPSPGLDCFFIASCQSWGVSVASGARLLTWIASNSLFIIKYLWSLYRAGFLSVVDWALRVVSCPCHDPLIMFTAKINKNTQKLCCYPRQPGHHHRSRSLEKFPLETRPILRLAPACDL